MGLIMRVRRAAPSPLSDRACRTLRKPPVNRCQQFAGLLHGRQFIEDRIVFACSPATFGGKRVYLLCPGCECRRRVSELYFARGIFRCRTVTGWLMDAGGGQRAACAAACGQAAGPTWLTGMAPRRLASRDEAKGHVANDLRPPPGHSGRGRHRCGHALGIEPNKECPSRKSAAAPTSPRGRLRHVNRLRRPRSRWHNGQH